MTDAMERFQAAVSAVCPIVGVGEEGDGFVYWPDDKATDAQREAAEKVAAAYVRSPYADADFRAMVRRRQAAVALLGSDQPISVAIRAVVRDIYTQINDVREAAGLPRVLEHVVIPRLIEQISNGAGDSMPGF